MSNNLIRKGEIQVIWNVSYSKILRVTQEVWHEGLKEHKVISAPEKSILNTKVQMQVAKWNERWTSVNEKQKSTALKMASLEEAQHRTEQAKKDIESIENILLFTLDVNDMVNWDTLKNKNTFKEKQPSKPSAPAKIICPAKPDKDSPEFTPLLSFISTKVFKSIGKKRIEECDKKYSEALSEWEKKKNEVDSQNEKLAKEFEDKVKSWEISLQEWENSKSEFLENKRLYNESIDNFKHNYLNNDPQAILEYCEIVLNNSQLPDCFIKNFELDYIPDSKIFIVDYKLPVLEDLPTLKEVKFIQSRNELKESYYTTSFTEKLYDITVYSFILRVLHELFEADIINAIEAVSLNGWVNYINKATGKPEDACIVSIQVKKDTFNEIDLKNVDPKICFKSLKGIGSSKLYGITPIQPILQINKNDRRFIQSYDVAHELDSSTNLATLDWEDFEHLIRELFEKEFSSNGGEVKVTQASRDGGVDAVAFDPDPIRGGKIVIQAKRYTNVVGLSAIRDLYGTVVNEGATKGILVTTADYGHDAYEFAKSKPLTLLNGGNLLHLLEKHGHKARIDLKEAKLINKENAK